MHYLLLNLRSLVYDPTEACKNKCKSNVTCGRKQIYYYTSQRCIEPSIYASYSVVFVLWYHQLPSSWNNNFYSYQRTVTFCTVTCYIKGHIKKAQKQKKKIQNYFQLTKSTVKDITLAECDANWFIIACGRIQLVKDQSPSNIGTKTNFFSLRCSSSGNVSSSCPHNYSSFW